MGEAEHRTFDILLKCIAIIGAIGSFLWGVYQYVDTEQRALDAERIARDTAFAEELFKRRVDEYQSIALAAGKLSAPADKPGELAADIKRFERLYWGSIATLRSDSVIKAMDYLRSGIENYKQGRKMLGDSSPEDQLKVRARALSRAIRSAIDEERQALSIIHASRPIPVSSPVSSPVSRDEP